MEEKKKMKRKPSGSPRSEASVLHHESFLWYRVEVNQLELEIKELAQKKDMYKLLSEQQEGVIKNLQAELDGAQKEASVLRREHADLIEKVKVFEVRNEDLIAVANDNTSQVQQKTDQIDQLRKEMDEIQVMADGWKSKMDLLDSEKETAQDKLSSVEVQLRVAKEKDDKRAQQNEDLRTQLGSAIAERDTLGKEIQVIRSKLEITSADADEMVAQYKADVEAAEARLKTTAEYVRRLS
ncbi:WEB family protein At1g12150-like [Nicotiana tomentosiformis]|uniref:WEB family protein At1g12150-like n=1 Tax=Nicotiana tomentosiformis TaxID=4098 RepID=UPI00388CBB72